MISFYVACAVITIIYVILITSLIIFRHSTDRQRTHFHQRLWVEWVWTTIPFIVLVILLLPTIEILQ